MERWDQSYDTGVYNKRIWGHPELWQHGPGVIGDEGCIALGLSPVERLLCKFPMDPVCRICMLDLYVGSS